MIFFRNPFLCFICSSFKDEWSLVKTVGIIGIEEFSRDNFDSFFLRRTDLWDDFVLLLDEELIAAIATAAATAATVPKRRVRVVFVGMEDGTDV